LLLALNVEALQHGWFFSKGTSHRKGDLRLISSDDSMWHVFC